MKEKREHRKDVQQTNIGKYLKAKRLEWAGYVWRADGSLIRNVFN
jgi:hypothetical protein